MDNDEKLKALTNEPVKAVFGGEEFTLRRPTLRDYKKLRGYFKDRNMADGKLPEDDAVDFGTFFISTLLIDPKYTQDELEDKILITDLENMKAVIERLGFTKPQPKVETNQETAQVLSKEADSFSKTGEN